MEIYNHFEYGEQLARKLKAIHHTDEKPRFFCAYGLEDLFTFDDKLSSIDGPVLIAVDGYESNSTDNRADGLNDTRQYGFIVARPTVSDRPETITSAFDFSHALCKQIRNALLLDPGLQGYINRATQINGIGPIGDNFYGCMLSISVNVPESFMLDASFWEE